MIQNDFQNPEQLCEKGLIKTQTRPILSGIFNSRALVNSTQKALNQVQI